MLEFDPHYYSEGLFSHFNLGVKNTWFNLIRKDMKDSLCFLSQYQVKSNMRLRYQKLYNGEKDYFLNYNEYHPEVWISLYDPAKQKDVLRTKINLPYLHSMAANFSGLPGIDGRNGKDGKHYQFKSEAQLHDSLPSMLAGSALNGTDGFNGSDGSNGKNLQVSITRASRNDSIAKVTFTSKDTSFTIYIDFIYNSSLRVYSNGGKGGNGGDAGVCGKLFLKGKSEAVKEGISGQPGKGGNSGSGGNVTLNIDTFYIKFLHQKIEFDTSAGEPGFGGFDPRGKCTYNPYNTSSSGGLLGMVLGWQNNNSKVKSYKATDLAEHGTKGKDGALLIHHNK